MELRRRLAVGWTTLRRTSGLKAMLLAVLGAVMAVPVGLIPIAIYLANATTELTMHIPWRTWPCCWWGCR